MFESGAAFEASYFLEDNLYKLPRPRPLKGKNICRLLWRQLVAPVSSGSVTVIEGLHETADGGVSLLWPASLPPPPEEEQAQYDAALAARQ